MKNKLFILLKNVNEFNKNENEFKFSYFFDLII